MSRLLENIINAVSKETGITRKEIMNGDSTRRVTSARYMVVYILRKRHGWTFPDIGEVLGKEESTMRSAFNSMSRLVNRGRVQIPGTNKKEIRAQKIVDEISEHLFEAIVRVI